MPDRPKSIPLTRFTHAAHEVVHDARERRMLLPGSDPKVDELESALDGLSLSAAPPEQLAWRETFLWRLPRPEVATAFRFVGDALFDLMNEAGAWGPDEGVPTTVGEIRAASDDLDDLVHLLEQVASDRHHSTLDEVSDALAIEASGWAERLAGLVRDMRRSLRRGGDEPGPDPANDHDSN